MSNVPCTLGVEVPDQSPVLQWYDFIGYTASLDTPIDALPELFEHPYRCECLICTGEPHHQGCYCDKCVAADDNTDTLFDFGEIPF